MPELPEMENYKQLLTDRICGKVMDSVQVNREKSINVTVDSFKQEVEQQRVLHIERRAKHLLFHLSTGKVLVLHLMLGGFMFYGSEQEKPNRSVQVRFSWGESHLYFMGLRLGYLHLLKHKEAAQKLSHLGCEPLHSSFTPHKFEELVKHKRGILKSALVDQSFIAGIGNCYADEICFHAALLPMKKWSQTTSMEISRLFDSIRLVLREAIERGGYMESPLFAGDTLTGGYNEHCKVYDREGQPCPRCGQLILKEMISSRKVFYCSYCQS
jgi:formamidopyrimidine-DNA glycosylase